MKKLLNIAILLTVLIFISVLILFPKEPSKQERVSQTEKETSIDKPLHPLSIEAMRNVEYPGSDIVIEQTLPSGSNYKRYLASYKSDGFKIFALLTIPNSQMPKEGLPTIIFNHGYIPPAEYRTTERYISYVDAFARNGYVVFKPDYRGHGNSEGEPLGAYYSPAYTTDVLNALSSIKKLKEVNSERIGMWGHSMGGSITLRSLTISKDIKASVIWAGVVGSYSDLIERWRRRVPWVPSSREQMLNRPSRQRFVDQFGTPEQNPVFWNSIDPINFISDISSPIQLHHGTSDESVPVFFSESLKKALEMVGKTVEFYTYEGADHNISSPHFELAIKRSVAFFDKYLKQ